MKLKNKLNIRYLRKAALFFWVLLQCFIFPISCDNAEDSSPCDYTIVFVHLGDGLPDYLDAALKQARLFNPRCAIMLVANQRALTNIPLDIRQQRLHIIPCESLQKTPEHREFIRKIPNKDGFWTFANERFLYLYDLMVQYRLKNVFHLENDNMLYADLSTLLPAFQEHYKGIAATFDNDHRCIAGFIYISDKESMQKLAQYFASSASTGKNDMVLIALFKEKTDPSVIDYLPIISREYIDKRSLRSKLGAQTSLPYKFCNHIDVFQFIFDAAALGQYLGGTVIDDRPGFINESCLFSPAFMTYRWLEDPMGRKVPYAAFEGKEYPIVNLHIHSKKLSRFSSF